MKHVGSLDVRKDLRVRGRVEENLRVRKDVEASAFYVRGVGELLPSNSFVPVIKAKISKSNTVVNLEADTVVVVPVPLTGTYHLSVEGILNVAWTETSGGAASYVIGELEEKKDSGSFSLVDSHIQGNVGGTGDDNLTHFGRATLFYDFGGPENGATYSYRLSATPAGSGSLVATNPNPGATHHRIRARLDRIG